MLDDAGYEVSRSLVPDDADRIAGAILEACSTAPMVLTTGGTGFGRRDVTPEATASILEREAPGLVHVMLVKGLESTPLAGLTRARAGTIGGSLVVNLPGSPKGATESLAAIIDLLPHALQLLGGDNRHH
jgi:molybdenum cofactor synthesis domain-containing protein